MTVVRSVAPHFWPTSPLAPPPTVAPNIASAKSTLDAARAAYEAAPSDETRARVSLARTAHENAIAAAGASAEQGDHERRVAVHTVKEAARARLEATGKKRAAKLASDAALDAMAKAGASFAAAAKALADASAADAALDDVERSDTFAAHGIRGEDLFRAHAVALQQAIGERRSARSAEGYDAIRRSFHAGFDAANVSKEARYVAATTLGTLTGVVGAGELKDTTDDERRRARRLASR